MAKGTVILLFFLGILAALLVGINFGKNINSSQTTNIPSPTNIPQSTTHNLQPTTNLSPSPESTNSASISAIPIKKITGTSTFTDKTCGISFSYPGAYLKQKTTNNQSTIFTDPDDPTSAIAVACSSSIPRPPVTSDKIESIMVAGVAATLYHDQNPDGAPRDEVIVKNPNNDLEIIIAGFGPTFQSVLKNLRFVQ